MGLNVDAPLEPALAGALQRINRQMCRETLQLYPKKKNYVCFRVYDFAFSHLNFVNISQRYQPTTLCSFNVNVKNYKKAKLVRTRLGIKMELVYFSTQVQLNTSLHLNNFESKPISFSFFGNFAREQEFIFSSPWHVVYIFVIPVLVSLLQVDSQSKGASPF